MNHQPPQFCDFDCPFADFPPAETAGICRTMAAVWCRQLKELVNKNAACEYSKRPRPAGKARDARGRAQKRRSPR